MDWPVALVSMPFHLLARPSIQLGLLKATGEARGFAVTTYHLTLDFARRVGVPLYFSLSESYLGDWLFSVEAFGEDAPDRAGRFPDELTDHDLRAVTRIYGGRARDALRTVRERHVPRYLDHLVEGIPWEHYRAVGFTCTFQQNAASFALARRIKARWPELVMLFGGANFDGEMGEEWVRAVPWIDYAVSGEADMAFPQLLAALAAGRDPAAVPGVIIRRGGKVLAPLPGRPFEPLDALPVPDYQEYFDRAEALGLLTPGAPRTVDIPFESARGCWWGQRRHCTFCGLNGTTMRFRSKSPVRLMAELAELARRYGSTTFESVDNILDPRYVDEVLGPLADGGAGYRFFYEVKANLSRAQLERMRAGGVRRVQPGIESLSSHVLALMRKGVRASQNVNVLRWATYYGMEVNWNVIFGFAGEREDDVEHQTALVPALAHLPPPSGFGRIRVERFSPIYEDRESFPVRDLRPHRIYAAAYPPGVDLYRAAYDFEGEVEGSLPDSAYGDLERHVAVWQRRWRAAVRPTLTFWRSGNGVHVDDRRDPARPTVITLAGLEAELYVACSERPESLAALCEQARFLATAGETETTLDDLCQRALMMRDGNLFLTLALPRWTETL